MYETVFEISQKGYEWWWPATLAGFALFWLAFARFLSVKPEKKDEVVFGYCLFVFTSFLSVLIFFNAYPEYRKFRTAYAMGQYEVIEGRVERFRPMPYEGHSLESFVVAGTRFSYSDFVSTPGFNNTASHGGPIRDGLWVRIAHRNGVILKLEIRPDNTMRLSN